MATSAGMTYTAAVPITQVHDIADDPAIIYSGTRRRPLSPAPTPTHIAPPTPCGLYWFSPAQDSGPEIPYLGPRLDELQLEMFKMDDSDRIFKRIPQRVPETGQPGWSVFRLHERHCGFTRPMPSVSVASTFWLSDADFERMYGKAKTVGKRAERARAEQARAGREHSEEIEAPVSNFEYLMMISDPDIEGAFLHYPWLLDLNDAELRFVYRQCAETNVEPAEVGKCRLCAEEVFCGTGCWRFRENWRRWLIANGIEWKKDASDAIYDEDEDDVERFKQYMSRNGGDWRHDVGDTSSEDLWENQSIDSSSSLEYLSGDEY